VEALIDVGGDLRCEDGRIGFDPPDESEQRAQRRDLRIGAPLGERAFERRERLGQPFGPLQRERRRRDVARRDRKPERAQQRNGLRVRGKTRGARCGGRGRRCG
jgi:hypothetical protein